MWMNVRQAKLSPAKRAKSGAYRTVITVYLQVRVYPVGISLPAFPKLLILAHPSLLLSVVIVHTEVQDGRRRHVRLNLQLWAFTSARLLIVCEAFVRPL